MGRRSRYAATVPDNRPVIRKTTMYFRHFPSTGTVRMSGSDRPVGGFMSHDQPKVDNPQRQALVTLKTNIERAMHDLTELLKNACANVGDGGSWVGPTAVGWHTEIEGRRKDMLAQLAKLVPTVQAAINTCPEQVTQSEAKMMRMDMQRG